MNKFHLFFDLDRTLWDFEKNSEIALRQLFNELKISDAVDEFHQFHVRYKENNAALWKLYGAGKLQKEVLRDERFRVTLQEFGIDDPDIVQQMSNGYVEISPRQTALFPAAIETLRELNSAGFNMHIITNGFREVQEVKIENSGLTPYFDVIVCSEDVGQNKPAPAIFQHSLQKAGAQANDSIMIGDDYEVDILGAVNAGMQGILFDPEEHHNSDINQHKIKSLSEIPGILPWIIKDLI